MILSVDMGFSNYGLSIWKNNQPVKLALIQTKKDKTHRGLVSEDIIRRHKDMCNKLHEIIRRYRPQLLVGEMPTFGAQSSAAAVAMTIATITTLTLCEACQIKTLWHTPKEIKKHFIGDPNASKQEIMERVCQQYNWPIIHKRIKDPRLQNGYRIQPVYHIGSTPIPAGKFEHIADSIAAYHTAKHFYRRD